jgi:NADH-quinone oxidoreductase subunit N
MTGFLASLDPQTFRAFADGATADLKHFHAELALVVTIAYLVLISGFFPRGKSERVFAAFSMIGVLDALKDVILRYDSGPVELFHGLAGGGATLRIDKFANFFSIVFLVGTLVTIVLCYLSKELEDRPLADFFAIMLSAVLGMMLMAEAVDLLTIFVGVELLSVPSYVLTGWVKKSRIASEAALKYVIYGSVSAGLMIYGFSLFYGMTGSLKLPAIAALVQSPGVNVYGIALAAFLVFAGFGYKMAAVPMQFWAPDVYQGAPTPVTAWLSVTSKAAGIAVFIRFVDALGLGRGVTTDLDWVSLVALIAAITMTLGNLGALHQTSVKRLLAYSSVAHVGYILMGVAAFGGTGEGWKAVAFYVVAYLLMNLGAFACVLFAANQAGTDDLDAFRGLGYRAPRIAFAFAIFLISLIGIPPTAGFAGKFQLFMVAVNQGLIWLVVVAAVNTAISAFYYVKILRTMYLAEAEGAPLRVPAIGEALVYLHVLAVIAFGIFFSPLVERVRDLGPLH